MLEESGYEELYQKNMEAGWMIHGEYNHHNILMANADTKCDQNAITNFDKFKKDIQVEDLYYFLRKIMEKHGWKERLGDSMINAYAAVKPLTEQQISTIARSQFSGEVDDIEFVDTNDGGYYNVDIENEEDEATLQIHALTGEVLTITYDD